VVAALIHKDYGPWQAFAVLLPIRTVGVMGDFRTYVGRAGAEGQGGVRLRRYRVGSRRPDHQSW
jgi:GMP synthase PP-ATPase subunit